MTHVWFFSFFQKNTTDAYALSNEFAETCFDTESFS